MSEGNNTQIIDSCIQEFKETNQLGGDEGAIFELFVGMQITKSHDLDANEIRSAIVDGSKDGGIDLFLPLLDDFPVLTWEEAEEVTVSKQASLTLIVGQSKHKTSFQEDVLDKWISSMSIILRLGQSQDELAERFNSSLCEKILVFHHLLKQVVRKPGSTITVRYVYATRANEFQPTETFRSKTEQLVSLTKMHIDTATVDASFLSAKQLFQLYQSDTPESRDLVFAANPLAVKYGAGIGYVGLVPLRELKKFITVENTENDVDERVFESNVRHFQGNVDVNSKIKATVREDKERDFWWLNNGVTIVSPSAQPLANNLTITDPQIVNGLQTSYSIHAALEDAPHDTRCVLVKVIVSSDKSTVDRVIRATNSQTAVGAASLRATDEVQRDLEAFFEAKGYFYDRRKNFYRSQGKPLARIFSIPYVAQCVHSILNFSPAAARARPSSLINIEATYTGIFDSRKDFGAYLNSCLIVRAAKDYIATISDDTERAKVNNYVFHISQIAASFAIGKGYYSDREVSSVALGKVSAAVPSATQWLMDYVSYYQQQYGIQYHNTISKQESFSTEVINALRSHLAGDRS